MICGMFGSGAVWGLMIGFVCVRVCLLFCSGLLFCVTAAQEILDGDARINSPVIESPYEHR